MGTQKEPSPITLRLGMGVWPWRILTAVSSLSAGGAVGVGLYTTSRRYEDLPLAAVLIGFLTLHAATGAIIELTKRRLYWLAWAYISSGIAVGAIEVEELRCRSLATAADRTRMARAVCLVLVFGGVVLLLCIQSAHA